MIKSNDITSIKAKVLKLFGSQLNISITDNLTNKSLRNELGIDSIQKMNVIVMIEKFYHIPISDEDDENFNTMNDIIQFIEKWHQRKYLIKHYNSAF